MKSLDTKHIELKKKTLTTAITACSTLKQFYASMHVACESTPFFLKR